MIVGGQPTIDDDRDDGDNELADVVARLQAELAKLVAKNDRLEAKVARLEADQPAKSLENCKSLTFCLIIVFNINCLKHN